MVDQSPVNDAAARLSALASFNIIDTAPEVGFDDIANLAAQICQAPIALVSLVENHRQWFKSHIGLDICETPVSQSVCAFALGQADLLVIDDLTKDQRTKGNALVTGDPLIRFYAGAQLRTAEGVAIGTLCVIDKAPRPGGLTAAQAAALRTLANQVMSLLELRRTLEQRDRAIEAQHAREQDLRRDAARHDALFDLHRRIEGASDVKGVLALLVEGSLALIPAAEGAVIELRDGDELVYDAAAGLLAQHVGLRLPIEGSLSGLSFSQGLALYTDDATHDARLAPAQRDRLGMRSMIVVPIARHRDNVGVLKVSARAARAFSQKDVQTVQLLAAAAAAGLAELGEAEARRHVETSEARYRTIFESAIDFAIIALDLDARITNWNAGAQRIFGWTADEMIGQPFATLFTAEDRAKKVPEREMREALRTGRGNDERWHARKNGTTLWASGETMVLRADSGAAVGFVKMLRDRTAQRDAEEGLRKNEERLSFAFDAAGAAGWWDWDVLNDRVYTSTRLAEFYGLDPDVAVAGVSLDTFIAAIHPDDRALFIDAIGKTMAEGGAFALEYRLTDGAGVTRWVFARGNCYHDIDGNAVRFPGVAIDVTERKERERLQGALLALGDRLRDAETAADIARAYGQIAAEALKVSRAGLGAFDGAAGTTTIEADWSAPGTASIAGLHRVEMYGTFFEDLKQGRTVIIPDISLDPRTQSATEALRAIDIAALVNAPVMERGGLAAIFFVHHPEPRTWLPREITFIREMADRTRAALARIIAEERQLILNQELSHRMKNTLAMVQGIATQTMRNSTTLQSARDTLASRLMVFGKAHDILLNDNAESTGLTQLMRTALSLHDDGMPGRITLKGPDLQIGRRAALSLALMFHELATNAVKYGALSLSEGHIDVTWTVDPRPDDPQLVLEWRERAGPTVQAPTRKGFGSKLIERGLAGSLGGSVTIDYDPAGIVCSLTASLAAIRSDN